MNPKEEDLFSQNDYYLRLFNALKRTAKYGLSTRIINAVEDEEDFAQNVLYEYFLHPEKFDAQRASLEYYLHCLLRRRILNIGSKQTRQYFSLFEIEKMLESRYNNISIEVEEMCQKIYGRLSFQEKQLFILLGIEEPTNKIAQELNITSNAVYTRTYRLRRKMKRMMIDLGYSLY